MENKTNLAGIISLIVGAQVIIVALILSILFSFSTIENVVMCWILTTFFAIFCFFLLGNRKIIIERRIPVEKKVVEFVEKPVYIDREVIKEVPVEKKVVEVIEKPVYIEKPAKTVFVEKQRKKLFIKKYNFLASTQEKRYHKHNCRLAKIIKKKYKIQNDSASFFKKRHYVPCKLCIKK